MHLQPPLGRGGTSQVTSVASRSSEALKYQSEIATAQPHHTAGCITPAAPAPSPLARGPSAERRRLRLQRPALEQLHTGENRPHLLVHRDGTPARDDHPALGVQHRQSLPGRGGRGRLTGLPKDLSLLFCSQLGVHYRSSDPAVYGLMLLEDRPCAANAAADERERLLQPLLSGMPARPVG